MPQNVTIDAKWNINPKCNNFLTQDVTTFNPIHIGHFGDPGTGGRLNSNTTKTTAMKLNWPGTYISENQLP